MSDVIISTATYNYLVQHLVNIEDKKSSLASEKS